VAVRQVSCELSYIRILYFTLLYFTYHILNSVEVISHVRSCAMALHVMLAVLYAACCLLANKIENIDCRQVYVWPSMIPKSAPNPTNSIIKVLTGAESGDPRRRKSFTGLIFC